MKHIFKITNKLKFAKKTRNILIIYAMIFASGLYILFIDNAFLMNQIVIFERNLNFINAPNYRVVTGNSSPDVDLRATKSKKYGIFSFQIRIIK